MARNLGINIKIGADLKNFSKDMQNVSRQMKKTGQRMQSLGKSMSAALTLPLAAAGVAMIKFASDTEESLNKVDVAFGDSSKEVQKFAETTLKSFGIARGTALDMAATFGDMATSMGLPQSEAAKMSTSLVGLAGDLASFKNIRIDVAKTALNSIFTGETESLKGLGIVMTQANLSAFALEQGIQKPLKAMSEGEKTMLRYQFVMAKTANAHGDFERTGGGAANQMRIFQEGLKEVAEKFGSLVLPIFTKVVSKLNEAVTWFSSLDEGIKKTILIVGGLVAATGPLLYVTGGLIKVFSNYLPILLKFKNIFLSIPSVINLVTPLLYKLGLSITAMLGPIGLVAVAAAGLTFAFYKLVTSKKEFSAVSKDVIQNINSERLGMNAMFSALRSTKEGTEARTRAITELNTKYGEYLPFQITEKTNLKEIANAQTIANQQLLKNIVLKSKAADIEAANARFLEKTKEAMEDLSSETTKAKSQVGGFTKNISSDEAKAFEIAIVGIVERLKDTSSLEKYTESLRNIRSEINQYAKDNKFAVTRTRQFNNAILGIVNPSVDLRNEMIEVNQEYSKMEKLLGVATTKSKKFRDEIEKPLAVQGGTLNTSIGSGDSEIKEFTVKPILTLDDDAFQRDFDRYIERQEKGFGKIKMITSDAQTDMDELFAGQTQRMAQFAESMKNAATQLRNGLVSLGTDAVEGVFYAMGQAASGVENSFKDFGKSVLQSVASFMSDFGKLLIAGAIASEAMQKTLFTRPELALAAGVALVATAGLIKGLSSKNPTSYDGGGGGSSAPISGGYSGYGTNNSNGIVTLQSVIYGSDIQLSSNRANNTTMRTRPK